MTDIIIGARRPPKRRAFRQVVLAGCALVFAGAIGVFVFRRAVAYEVPDTTVPDAPLRADPARGSLAFAGASLTRTGHLTVLHLSGTPAAIGVARGRLLGRRIDTASAALWPTIDHAISSGGLFGGLTHGARLDWALRHIARGIPGHQLVEIAGVVAGSEATSEGAPSYRRLVRDAAAIDIGHPAPTADSFGRIARALTIIAGPEKTGGRMLIGRTFGVPGARGGGAALAANPVVAFVHPDGVIPFVTVGWPALTGAVTGINAEGIAVLIHPGVLEGVRPDRIAQPIPLLARDILENARVLPDAIAILEHAHPLGAARFVIVDAKARTWAAIDRGPDQVAVAKDNPPAVVTGILAGAPFAEDPKNDRARRTSPAAARAARAAEILATTPPAVAADMAALLRDRRAAGGAPLSPGHRGAIADPSAQHAIIFDASAMVLYVSEGPGAAGRFFAFDLRYELSGRGARPAPPPPLASAGPDALDEATAQVTARGYLAAARAARADDELGRARELCARALAIAPGTPEVLLLATELAREAGDGDRAQALAHRYLNSVPDDVLAADRLRGLY